MISCPQCDKGNPPEFRWCRYCGAPFATAPTLPVRDVRRTVTNRRVINAMLGSSLLLSGTAAMGQQRTARLGWLLGSSPRSASFNAAFERRLRELGHVDGRNLIIDDVFAEGKVERLGPLARELVARKPDVLFMSGPEANLKALSEATRIIPIVVCARLRP